MRFVDLTTEIGLQELFSIVYIFFPRKMPLLWFSRIAGLSSLFTDVPPPSGKMTSPLPIFPEGGGDVCTQARLELFNDYKSRTRPGLVLQVRRSQSCNQKRRA